MSIDHFVERSTGTWRSMRSAHSLAFRQFEDVLSEIQIQSLSIDEDEVSECLAEHSLSRDRISNPFRMRWHAESDWESDDPTSIAQGSCILIPIPDSQRTGKLLRSKGYAESTSALSTYSFLDDDTFILRTIYDQSMAEERIWFLSEHLRCRSSVLRTSEGSGILQTSFCSEIRKIEA